jgi:hypothetical protein
MVAGAGRRLLGLLVFAGLFLSAAARGAEIGFAPVELRVSPIERFALGSAATTFGALEFRGGIEVASRNADFGGFSGLDFAPDGSLVAVADTGFWFTARPVESDGRLRDLVDARLAPILDSDGKRVEDKRRGDAEGLRITTLNGRVAALVSFERSNDVRRFLAAPDLAHARPEPVRLPKAVARLHRNSGPEAIAVAPSGGPFAGALALLAEHSLDGNGNHRGWIVGGPRAGTFSVARIGEYDVTDAAFLENSDLLVLERSFSYTTGVAMRIRRIAAADLQPGATVDGRVLAEADMRYQIDNMEGMALSRGRNGETLITLLSDDNQSMIQRTIFLRFALAPDAPPKPRPRPEPSQ